MEVFDYGVVILTMGKRLDDLKRGIDSLLSQRNVNLDVVCVGNGWDPVGLPEEVKTHMLPENVGIPAGRNAGVPLVKGEFLFFLDDFFKGLWFFEVAAHPDGEHGQDNADQKRYAPTPAVELFIGQ